MMVRKNIWIDFFLFWKSRTNLDFIVERFSERTKIVHVYENLRYIMSSFSPKEIYELEKQLGYSFQNLQPFYTLCESLVPEIYLMGAFCMEFLSWDGTY